MTRAGIENTQVILLSRSQGVPQPKNFELIRSSVPECPAGGILIRNRWLAVDPAMRGWVNEEASYVKVEPGTVMRAWAVGEVIASRCAQFRVGDMVRGVFNWQTYCTVIPDANLVRIDTDVIPAPLWLGPFGYPGLAAWLGVREHLNLSAGETLLVSTAAGAVGGVVGQLAKHLGVRCVGVTGSDAKVQRCLADFGYSEAINYHRGDFQQALSRAVPAGIDGFFDNTGGALSDVVFEFLNKRARIFQCGTAAVADWSAKPAGPRRERDMLIKELRWSGLVALHHSMRLPDAHAELSALYQAGKLNSFQHILHGIERAPEAIALLYAGGNDGRLLIQL